MNEQAQGHHNAEEAKDRDRWAELLDKSPERLKDVQYHIDAALEAISRDDGEELEGCLEDLRDNAEIL